ncbi:MAG: ATP-binding protein [Anaerolineae bacterium]|nr:ATP-binding protein [Anaerolineae bacterium]
MYHPRFLTQRLQHLLTLSPVVVLQGARQTGKSTLVQHIAKSSGRMRYRSMDDLTVFAAAQQDPQGFVASHQDVDTLILDEIQRAQQLLLPIKVEVDRDRRAGRFLLTGSAHTMILPRIADSLAGRLRLLTLWGLSQDELQGTPSHFLQEAFSETFAQHDAPNLQRADIVRRITRGGYPEMTTLAHTQDRADWVNAYITALLQRDVRDLAQVEGLSQFPRLLSLIATRSSGLLNTADLSRSLGLSNATLRRYLTLLEATFLLMTLPAYFNNLGKRIIKMPKIYVCDTGILCGLLGLDEQRLLHEPTLLGAPLETFVVTELLKMSEWSQMPLLKLYHFQNHDNREVDVVLERADGKIVGIEVKAAASASAADFKGLHALAEAAGDRFIRGLVLYLGPTQAQFAPNLWAVPLSRLWGN